ncbi:hypothetical protein M7I_7842 [Glarea lozoyensis 74030]|uniref:Uncharacterized protein n=1 Tax=Glarea lozoyensis (strain ATCC 74030 / MF5533) TaxID=1104152 RepID=H0EYE3_GLAL7|nr:hypothetical protein M7I_7842 [Glarea lozoyensis 74030]
MTGLARFFLIGGPLVLVLLTAVAGYAYSQIRYLGLPIPDALALFTVVLPIITGISMQGIYGLIQRASKTEPFQLTLPLVAVLGFQLFYETVVGTLALTYIVPPTSLLCGLDDMWARLYVANNGRAVKRIQDTFDCCGLRTIKDRKCKVMSVVFLLTNPTMSHARTSRAFKRITNRSDDDEEDSRATMRRLIEESASTEPYRDNPEDHQHCLKDTTSGEMRKDKNEIHKASMSKAVMR